GATEKITISREENRIQFFMTILRLVLEFGRQFVDFTEYYFPLLTVGGLREIIIPAADRNDLEGFQLMRRQYAIKKHAAIRSVADLIEEKIPKTVGNQFAVIHLDALKHARMMTKNHVGARVYQTMSCAALPTGWKMRIFISPMKRHN